MKQIAVTDRILAKLKAGGWDGNDVNAIAIYEATALNTLPLRKDHPVFNGALVQPGVLRKMAAQVNAESLPLQVMHNQEDLPIGRVFHGEVLNGENGPELRTLFWVDKTHQQIVDLINNSTVDQVSVNFQPKNAVCAACGFDFIGEDATIDHWWTGKDPEGHQMGKNGHHAVISDLTKWSEMSAVNRGGAQGARIASAKNSYFSPARMAAAQDIGPAAYLTALQLSSGELGSSPTNTEQDMDLKDLVAKLDEKGEKITALTVDLSAKDAQIAALTAQVTKLTADLEAATTLATETETKLTEATAKSGDAVKLADSLKKVATKFLTLSGKATDPVPAKEDELIALVEGSLESLRLGVQGSNAKAPDAEHGADKAARFSASAFRTPQSINA